MVASELLSDLTPDELRAFEAHTTVVEFPATSNILKAGSAGDDCYFIERGQVRVQLDRTELDSDDVLGYIDAGMVLGELSLLDGLPRSAGAYAHTDVVARRLRREDLDRLAEAHPRIGLALVRALGRSAALKLRENHDRLASVLFTSHDPEVDEFVARALAAQARIQDWPEARIDALLLAMSQALAQHAQEFAEATVAETGVGNVPDKTLKNQMACLLIHESFRGRPGHGPIANDASRNVTEWAAPVGVVFGLIPMTNPAATAIFKVLISLKSRNALIMSFHRRTLGLADRVGGIIQGVLRDHAAPIDLIQWVRERNSRKKTEQFMRHPGVSLILATGGSSMVKAAYSSGTPALGVGPGNAPVLICADADLDHAARGIVLSKAFDNGLICGSEHNLVAVAGVESAFIESLQAHGAAVLTAEETARFTPAVFSTDAPQLRRRMVGQSAAFLASEAGIHREYPIRLIVVPTGEVRPDNPYAREKMAPLLSLFTAENEEAGLPLCHALLQIEGAGHTAIIHTQSSALVERFAALMPAGRILVNSPGSHGVTGVTTGLVPSFTLGCGTFGGGSTTDNITYRHLLNIKRVAHYVPPTFPL